MNVPIKHCFPIQIKNIYGKLLGTILFLKQAFVGLSTIYESVPQNSGKGATGHI